MIFTEYKITNLAELIEMCQAIHNEACADAGRSVDPSEILIQSAEWNFASFTAKTSELSDGSIVYDVLAG